MELARFAFKYQVSYWKVRCKKRICLFNTNHLLRLFIYFNQILKNACLRFETWFEGRDWKETNHFYHNVFLPVATLFPSSISPRSNQMHKKKAEVWNNTYLITYLIFDPTSYLWLLLLQHHPLSELPIQLQAVKTVLYQVQAQLCWKFQWKKSLLSQWCWVCGSIQYFWPNGVGSKF